MNPNTYQWVRTMRYGGAIQRFHTTRTVRPQCIAAHSYGVAMVLLAVGVHSPAVLAYALLHDQAEQATGDIPAPAKWRSDALGSALDTIENEFNVAHNIREIEVALTHDEMVLVRWADTYELCQYALEEVHIGNRYMLHILDNGLTALRKCPVNVGLAWHDAVVELTTALVNDAQPSLHGYTRGDLIYGSK